MHWQNSGQKWDKFLPLWRSLVAATRPHNTVVAALALLHPVVVQPLGLDYNLQDLLMFQIHCAYK